MKRTSILVIGACAAALGLAGCSSAAHAGSANPTPIGNSGSGTTSPGAGQQRRFPGVSGLVADVTGTTAQVQGRTSQTAVTWTAATRFTQQRATSASAVHVGACVVARPARSTGTATGQAGPGGAAPGATVPTRPTTVAAATVEIMPATNGTCAFGNGVDRATRPSGIPTGAPNGDGSRRGFGFGFGAVGTVASISPGRLTVTPTAVARTGSTAGAAPATVTVTWTSATVFTTLAPATAAAVKVGVCVTAAGKPDDTGAVTATNIAVSQPVNGSCSAGFGFGGFGGRRDNGATGGTTAPAAVNG